jgi:hypothetical protein
VSCSLRALSLFRCVARRRAAGAGAWLLTVGALFSVGCDLPPATAIAVSVKTELAIGEELALVTYRVFEIHDDPDHSKPVSEFTTPAQSLDKPFVITRAHADEFLLSVEGFAPEPGEPVVIYREQVKFESGKTLALPVFLAHACYRVRCQYGGHTCYGIAYGSTSAGQCEKYPERDLEPVRRPGDESNWVPTPTTTLLDAGFGPSSPFGGDGDYGFDDDDDLPWSPRDAGITSPGSCSGLSAGRTCLPGPRPIDASVLPPLLERQ